MNEAQKKIAIIGSGISGLAAAYFLNKKHQVSLFEANNYLGGHTNTVDININGEKRAVDTGFLVFNDKTYPNLIALFDELNIQSYATEMTFGVSLNKGQLEWAGTNLSTVFAQKKNLFSPNFYRMIFDILKFNRDAEQNLRESIRNKQTLGELLEGGRYSKAFKLQYLLPMAAAIWSSSPSDILNFPASTFLRFCINHALLQVNDRPKWRTVVGGGRSYVKKIAGQLERVYLNSPVTAVTRTMQGIELYVNGETLHFDEVIFTCHAPDTLNILLDATPEERHLLGNARYQANSAFLHTDISLLPKNKKVWSAWNYLSNSSYKNVDENADANKEEAQPVCVSYLLNHLQDIQLDVPVIVTLNPTHLPSSEKILAKFDYQHPIFDQAAIHAQNQLHTIQGLNHTWFAGAWTGYGFHEDGLKSALRIVEEFECKPTWAKI